jgi:hypothetical protein
MFWRKTIIFSMLSLGVLAFGFLFFSIYYSNYYGRMMNDEAINTFQTSLPVMPKGTIPIDGGIEMLRRSDPKTLNNPLPLTPAVLEQGRKVYTYFCIQCHGPRLDGRATVGQSFFPLPADLLDHRVQSQSDGELFYKVSLGYKRQPPLYATVSVSDRWAVLRYLRILAEGRKRS